MTLMVSAACSFRPCAASAPIGSAAGGLLLRVRTTRLGSQVRLTALLAVDEHHHVADLEANLLR